MSTSAQPRTLVDVIAERLPDIVEHWTDRVRQDRTMRDLTPADLLDHVPQFSETVVDALRRRRAGAEPDRGADAADEHARLRLRAGFRLEQVVREYALLFDVICAAAGDEGLQLDATEVSILGECFQVALTRAAIAYVRHGDDELRRTGARLNATEARYRATFEEVPVGLAHVSLGGKWLEVNQRYCDILGYTHEELVGSAEELALNFRDVTHPEDIARDVELAEQLRKGSITHYTLEKRYLRKDRSIVWVELTVSLVRTFADAPDYYVAAALDISERKRLEAERQRNAVRLDILAHTSRALSSAGLEIEAVLRTVVHELGERLRDACGLRLTARNGEGLHPTASHHPNPEAREMLANLFDRSRQRKNEGLHGRLVETAAPVFLPRASLEVLRASSSPDYWAYLDRFRPHSLIGVPLVLGREVIGSLILLRDESPEPFSSDDVALVLEIAVRAALALENSRLYEGALASNRTLAEREADLRTLIETLQEGVIVHDVGGAIRIANSGAERLLGLTRAQMDGRSRIDPRRSTIREDGSPFPPEEHPASVTLRTGEPQTGIVMGVQHPDGRRGWLMINANPLRHGPHGEIAGAVVSFFDITATREAQVAVERALDRERAARQRVEQAAEQLREAVRAREEFLEVASHELRTPLTPISLRLQALERIARASPENDAAARLASEIAEIRKHLQRLNDLIEEMLDVSRISKGALALRLERVDLAVLVREVVGVFEPEAARRGSPLRIDAPATMEGTYDRMRVEQVLVNLLSNALKYGAGRPIDIHLTRGLSSASIAVRDRGIGIARDAQERIFHKFERAVSERNYGGLGLGLFIAREAARSMGGTLSVESALGQGATFTLELPMANGAEQAQSTDQFDSDER